MEDDKNVEKEEKGEKIPLNLQQIQEIGKSEEKEGAEGKIKPVEKTTNEKEEEIKERLAKDENFREMVISLLKNKGALSTSEVPALPGKTKEKKSWLPYLVFGVGAILIVVVLGFTWKRIAKSERTFAKSYEDFQFATTQKFSMIEERVGSLKEELKKEIDKQIEGEKDKMKALMARIKQLEKEIETRKKEVETKEKEGEALFINRTAYQIRFDIKKEGEHYRSFTLQPVGEGDSRLTISVPLQGFILERRFYRDRRMVATDEREISALSTTSEYGGKKYHLVYIVEE